MRRAFAWMLVTGCVPAIDAAVETSTASTATPTTSADGGTGSASESSTTAPSDTTAAGDGAAIVSEPDLGSNAITCDVWGQDCPPGEKCTPYSRDGGNAWDAVRCSPIADDPKAPGEACTVVDGGQSGIDDCERGAMCWSVDFETNLGECVERCHGSPGNPLCSDPCTRCSIFSSDWILALCLPDCDPLAQDCGPGQACYLAAGALQCVPYYADEPGLPGDPCDFPFVCDPGNTCLPAAMVPGCAGATGCCAPFCDANTTNTCDALLPGTSCVPLFDRAEGPEACLGIGVIGVCTAT